MADEIWLLEDEPITVSFDTKGYAFYKGARGLLGTPVERFLRLVAVKGPEKVELPRVADLRGRVGLASPDQALEFVRLFTSPETHYLFPESQVIEPRAARGDPGPGEYPEEYGERLQLEPARARAEGETFVVERNLVDRAGTLLRATERVGQDGAYALERTTTIDAGSPVTFPLYE